MALTKVTYGLISADTSAIDLNIDQNTLYVETSGNRVGIGTTSPGFKLQINGTDNSLMQLKNTNGSSGQVRLQFNRDSATRWNIGANLTNDFTFYDQQNTTTPFKIESGAGDNTLVVDSNSRVGIGTTSPSRQLVIYNTSNSELELYSGTTSNGFIYFRDSGDSNIGALQYNHNGNYMAFRVNDAERIRIDGSGNVLIGETSAITNNKLVAKLADSGVTATSNQSVAFLENNTNAWLTIGSGTSSYGGILFADSGDSDIGQVRYNHNGNEMEFITNTAVAMTIDSSGNVGIGTSSPDYPLEIENSAAYHVSVKQTKTSTTDSSAYVTYYLQNLAGTSGTINGYLGIGGAGVGNTAMRNTVYMGSQSSHDVAIFTADSERMRIDSSGKVGIGTNSPQETLHLFNSAQTWNQYSNIRMSTESDSYAAEIGFHRGTSDDSDRGLFLSGDGTNKHVRVLHGGNVGIGTNPAFRFHAYHPTTNVVARFESGDNQVWIDLHDDGSAGYGALLGHDSDANVLFQVADASVNTKLIIKDTGNVGIGTTSPRHKLSVNGTLGSSTFSGFGMGVIGGLATAESGTPNAAIGMQAASATSSKIFAYDYAGSAGIPISIQPDNANVFICAGGGNVGIGTTSPTGKLHVSGGRMGVIASGSYSSWGHFRIANTSDAEISMAFINGATESDFLNDGNPACAYKVVLGINPYGAGNRNFGIGNDTMTNYHTIWTEDGHQLPRVNNTFDLGSPTKGWRNIYTNDLNLSNMPSEGEDVEGNAYTREGNEVDGTNGSWTIQEGADDLFLINRRNGRKYKFNLTEVTD